MKAERGMMNEEMHVGFSFLFIVHHSSFIV